MSFIYNGPVPRLCPTFLLAVVTAIVGLGCGGPNLEGSWYGEFPLEGAKDCRIRLWNEGRFDLSCKGDTWLGAGRWSQDRRNVTFTFAALTREGTMVSPLPEPMQLRYDGAGNSQCFGRPSDDGEPYCWKREIR